MFTTEITNKIKNLFDTHYSNSSFDFFEQNESNIILKDEKTISVNGRYDLSFSECKKILAFNDDKIKLFFDILKTRTNEDITSMTSVLKEVDKLDEFEIRKQNLNIDYPKLQLFHGDCRNNIKNISDGCVDLILTDPPYGIDFKMSRPTEEENRVWEEKESQQYYFDLFDDMCKEFLRVCKPNAHLYIFTGWRAIGEFKQIIEKYFEISNILVWVKNNHSLVDFSKRYSLKYENIFFCKIKGNNDRSLSNNISHDILEFSRVNKMIHPCQKPNDLLEYLIKNSSIEGEIVLDAFCGSHSTGVAALNLNRKFIGFELEEKFFKQGKSTLEKIILTKDVS